MSGQGNTFSQADQSKSGGGGGGTPGGSSGQLQRNNSGAFAGVVGSSADGSGNLTLGGPSLTVNTTNGATITDNSVNGITLTELNGGDGAIFLNGTVAITGLLNVNGSIISSLVGNTAAIGGSPLILGQQATGTAGVGGASDAIGAGAVIIVTPLGDPGNGFVWTGSLTGTDTITVKVICLVAGTPASLAYNVKVI